ncbi:MAG: YdiU family protein [Gammaproteobacteria bacterium]|nr:YdiU family protein [Gammaproteobacteria bacterium]
MLDLKFDNRFIQELPGDVENSARSRQVKGVCWSAVAPTPVAAPRLLAHSPEVAQLLDLKETDIRANNFAAVFAGNELLPGMQTYATCYGGHQFGHWAGQLGDGRAIYLGEVLNQRGERYELQLKGAGPTPYSRNSDGRAVLRSSLREFLCSEAMFHLGVPTTRALSLVATGDDVMRDMFYDGHPHAEQGAIVCRVAPSFIRFGHFEIFAQRGELDILQQLVDFTIDRDFPHLKNLHPNEHDNKIEPWFKEICARTARMVVEWMRVGFVHGVMNTDNMSILGLTIDYGPYGWVDNFDFGWTPNTTDASGKRYCFGRQPHIAQWNLQCLAAALNALVKDEAIFAAGLEHFDEVYAQAFTSMWAAKFGLLTWQAEDAALVEAVFDLMQSAEVDMTEFFRCLATIDSAAPQLATIQPAFYRDDLYQKFAAPFTEWLQRYALRLRAEPDALITRAARMNRVNPRFVLRNYLAQQAIELAEQGDVTMIEELLAVLRHPYNEQTDRAAFSAKRPDWARHKAGCSMLSCSS